MTDSIQLAQAKVHTALQELAQVTANLTPEKAAKVHAFVKGMVKLSDEMDQQVRQMLLLKLSTAGEPVGDKGSKRAVLDGMEVKAVISRTGYDTKKVVPLLNKRGIPLADGCDPNIEYKANYAKLEALHKAGKLSDADMLAMKYDTAYRLEVREAE
ncbi:MAG: hypothetical protein QM729_21370 [Solirubrobacterales bacterium]